MRRPGGAVRPAMKPTTGFLRLAGLENSAASSSASPPISPIMMIAFGLGVVQEQLQAVDEVGAVDRVAADADAGGLAEAGAVVCATAS